MPTPFRAHGRVQHVPARRRAPCVVDLHHLRPAGSPSNLATCFIVAPPARSVLAPARGPPPVGRPGTPKGRLLWEVGAAQVRPRSRRMIGPPELDEGTGTDGDSCPFTTSAASMVPTAHEMSGAEKDSVLPCGSRRALRTRSPVVPHSPVSAHATALCRSAPTCPARCPLERPDQAKGGATHDRRRRMSPGLPAGCWVRCRRDQAGPPLH